MGILSRLEFQRINKARLRKARPFVDRTLKKSSDLQVKLLHVKTMLSFLLYNILAEVKSHCRFEIFWDILLIEVACLAFAERNMAEPNSTIKTMLALMQ
jgi:hypothetical protein